MRDLLGGPVVGNLPANAEDTGSVPGWVGFHTPRGNWNRVSQILKPTHPRACALKKEFIGLDSISGLSVLIVHGHLSNGL